MAETGMFVVVADASGSMGEHGKTMLARNLIAFIREQTRSGDDGGRGPLNPVLVRWSCDTEVLAVRPDDDLPPWTPSGRAEAGPLVACLEGLLPGGQGRVLLLSDGHLGSATTAALKTWQRRHPEVSTRALAIGPDADKAALRKLVDAGGMLLAEDVVRALASWPLPPGPSLPTCITEMAKPEDGPR